MIVRLNPHLRNALHGALVLALAWLLVVPAPVAARGGGARPAPGAAPDPLRGPLYFDQAVRWVNGGRAGLHRLTDFYADLADVQFNVEGSHHEGYMRLWLKNPDKYRLELRPGRAMQRITTKILAGHMMWILHPNGAVQRMHGRPEGAQAVAQLQQDRKRLSDLSHFLTLEGLKGPGVQFVNEGPRTGSGTFSGNWMKVRRRLPGAADMTFHLAYARDPGDATGRAVVCTYPGVVTLEGDPRRGEPTEYYVLKNWKRGPQFSYPTRIEAYSQARPGARLQRFLLAFPNDIRINTGLADDLFAPPK